MQSSEKLSTKFDDAAALHASEPLFPGTPSGWRRDKIRVRRPANRTPHSLQNSTLVAVATTTAAATAVFSTWATPAAAAATRWTFFARPGDVHGQIAAIQ